MHYAKHFTINGVDTKQVACIELTGVPNAATEGAVGVLGMDMSSPTHEVYRCVAVNGSVYTWELLSAGMSILSATITRSGASTTTFPYVNLNFPTNYLIKVGDLILDKGGYLYQVSAIGVESCNAIYCGTCLGGSGAGGSGVEGFSPTITVTTISGGHRVVITDVNGTKTFDVMDGNDYTLTSADKQEIANLVLAQFIDASEVAM